MGSNPATPTGRSRCPCRSPPPGASCSARPVTRPARRVSGSRGATQRRRPAEVGGASTGRAAHASDDGRFPFPRDRGHVFTTPATAPRAGFVSAGHSTAGEARRCTSEHPGARPGHELWPAPGPAGPVRQGRRTRDGGAQRPTGAWPGITPVHNRGHGPVAPGGPAAADPAQVGAPAVGHAVVGRLGSRTERAGEGRQDFAPRCPMHTQIRPSRPRRAPDETEEG